jgi:pimeloyl-ACP methyl ester carboxylesterase
LPDPLRQDDEPSIPRRQENVTRRTVVILIHGIRTTAWWQSRIASVIADQLDATVIPLKYGYFDLFRFLCPFGFCRNGPIERLRKQLQGIRDDFPNCRLVVFAHSYGTYALSRILSENPRFTFNRVILCGSIVTETFDWDRVQNQILTSAGEDKRDAIINECGIRDLWPVIAKSISWGYGATGTYGFGVQNVRDRFHPAGHSAFFEPEFVQNYWIPEVAGRPIEYTPTDRTVINSPVWFGIFRFPFRWAIPIFLIVGLLLAGIPQIGVSAWSSLCISDCKQSDPRHAAKSSTVAFRNISRRNGALIGLDPIKIHDIQRLSSHYEVTFVGGEPSPAEINVKNGSGSLIQGFESITKDSYDGECTAAVVSTLRLSYKQDGSLDTETLLDQAGNVVERVQYPTNSLGQFVDAVFPCDHGRSGVMLVRF